MTKEYVWSNSTPDALAALHSSLQEAGGAFVSSAELPTLFDEVKIIFSFREEEQVCMGTVVNLPPGTGGFYVHFQDTEIAGKLLEWVGRCKDELSGPDEEAGEGERPEETREEDEEQGKERPTPAWELIDPQSSEPIHAQVRKLTLAEKLKVARTATRPVRELLIRDSEKRLHAEVIRNPKVTDDEIMQYTSMPNLSPRVLDWVANQPKHMRRRAVMLNVVQNPMTPPDTAKKLLSRLNDHELLRITRSSKVREVVSRAAKKILMRKGVL